MNTLVMSDGTAASRKAIELAGFPAGPMMPSHDGAQLIITHLWERSPGGVFSAEAVAALDGGSPQQQQQQAAAGGGGGGSGAAAAATEQSFSSAAAAGNSTAGTSAATPSTAAAAGRSSLTVEAALWAAAQTANSTASAGDTNGIIAVNAINANTTPNSIISGNTSAADASVAAAAAADGGGGGPAPPAGLSRQLPIALVLQRALLAISENKALRDSLNYKIETAVLSPAPPPPHGPYAADATPADATTPREKGGAKANKVPATAAARQQQQQQQQLAAEKAAAVAVAAAAAAAAASAAAAGKTKGRDGAAVSVEEEEKEEEEGLSDAEREARRLLSHRARKVVRHAEGRAEHHRAKSITLGVGSGPASGGKSSSVAVGSVARQALRALKGRYLLCFAKADGFALRPSTAAVRYLVVVALMTPPPSTAAIQTEEEKQKLAVVDTAATAAAVSAVGQALACCRKGSRDTVSVVLVVPPGGPPPGDDASSGDVTTTTTTTTTSSSSSSSRPAVAHCTERLTRMVLDFEQQRKDEAAKQEPEQQQQQTEEASANEAIITNMTATTATDDDTAPAAAAEVLPVVSVCELAPTKHVPVPTLANAATQVSRYLQQRKADVLVVSAAAPEPLQLTLLGMARPHCLVVPV